MTKQLLAALLLAAATCVPYLDQGPDVVVVVESRHFLPIRVGLACSATPRGIIPEVRWRDTATKALWAPCRELHVGLRDAEGQSWLSPLVLTEPGDTVEVIAETDLAISAVWVR